MDNTRNRINIYSWNSTFRFKYDINKFTFKHVDCEKKWNCKKINICETFDKTYHNVMQICQNDMVENTFEEHEKNVTKLHQWFFLSQMIKV